MCIRDRYDDVAPNINSVALVLGRNRVQGVPITTADSTQPAGTIPGRGAASTQGTGAAPGGASNPVDSATNAVNKATNTINDTKQKGKAALDSLKGATAK